MGPALVPARSVRGDGAGPGHGACSSAGASARSPWSRWCSASPRQGRRAGPGWGCWSPRRCGGCFPRGVCGPWAEGLRRVAYGVLALVLVSFALDHLRERFYPALGPAAGGESAGGLVLGMDRRAVPAREEVQAKAAPESPAPSAAESTMAMDELEERKKEKSRTRPRRRALPRSERCRGRATAWSAASPRRARPPSWRLTGTPWSRPARASRAGRGARCRCAGVGPCSRARRSISGSSRPPRT